MNNLALALADYELVRQKMLSLGKNPMTKCEIDKANQAARSVKAAAQAIKAGRLPDAAKHLVAANKAADTIAGNQRARGVSSSPRKKP